MPNQEKDISLNDDLNAAWEKVEKTEGDETDALEGELADGRETEIQLEPSTTETEELREPGPDGKTDDPVHAGGVPDGGEKTGAENKDELSSAPVGLSAAAKEVWKATPKVMRDEVLRRERDFAMGIQRYAEDAKLAVQIKSTLQPFQQYIAMNGGNPAQQVHTLFETASILQMGSPIQRAQTIANLISQFGVDIQALDHILIGKAPPESTQQTSMVQQEIERALAPYRQREEQLQANERQRVQNAQNQALQTVDQFRDDPKNEFYLEVREDMADILDLAANRGFQMSMKDAYDRACLLNPNVQEAIRIRKTKQSIGNKRNAASSISGTLGGPGGRPNDLSLRGEIENVWENWGRT
jgi:hypothetical protein